MVEKKNPDYTASAVNLVNPEEVKNALVNIKGIQIQLEDIKAKIEASIPQELLACQTQLTGELSSAQTHIREIIDTYGSFQDVAQGWYAVKQVKHTVSYEADLVRDTLEPKLATMVLFEAVDKVKLAGLVKGGFITQEQADKCGIAKIDYAYIIR